MRPRVSWFAFSPAEFLLDTMDMPLDSVGAYIRLMCHAFRVGGGIPEDQVFRLLGIHREDDDVNRIRDRILERFFTLENGRWVHPDMLRELELAKSKSEKARASVAVREERRKEAEQPETESETLDPQVKEIQRAVMERVKRAPKTWAVAKMLKTHTKDDIMYAFDEFTSSISEDHTGELKKAVWRFFESDDGPTLIDSLLHPSGEG